MLFVLTAGLLLTFSRSSVIAILVTFGLFALVRHGGWLARLNLRSVVNAITTIVGAAVIALLLYRIFPLAFDFFDARLFGIAADGALLRDLMADPTSSEGTRVYIASRILEFV